jgi:hypothetical protein
MSFLYPAFLLGALAIALPVILHLLRRDVAPEVPFTAVRLLRKSPIDRTRRRRLKDLLLLAARVAALALLALAFARPYFTQASALPRLRIVAIDRSFSLGAPGQFTRAVDLAKAAADQGGVGERVAVVAFDDRADVIAPPGAAGDARAALDGVSAGFGATRYAPMIAKAIELAAGDSAHLVVISDLQRNGWENEQPMSVPATLRIEVRDVDTPAANAAVRQVRLERGRIVATISNSAAAPFTGTARATVEGKEVGATPVQVGAGESTDVAVQVPAAGRGGLRFSIDDPQGLPADNDRFTVLDPLARTPIMLIAAAGTPASSVYFARALEAAEEQAFDLRIVTGSEASALSKEEAARYAAIVLLSTRGLDRRGREMLGDFVRGGGGLFVAASGDVEEPVLSAALGWQSLGAAEVSAPVRLSASDVRHPIFRPFGPFAANLGQVRFERIWKVKAGGWEVVARFTDGSPALLEKRDGNGRVLVFASDVDRRWNEFPLHPAFVPFAAESIRHIAGSRDGGREYLVADAPRGAKPVPGIYKLADGRNVAVNVDPRESSGARLTTQEFTQMLVSDAAAGPKTQTERPSRARAQNLEAGQSLWRYGLLLMLGVLVVECVIGGRS